MNRALLVLALAAACHDEPPPAPVAKVAPQAAIKLIATGETMIGRRDMEAKVTPREQIAAALGAPPDGEPREAGHSTHGRLIVAAPPVQLELYVDPGTAAADLVDVLDKASPRVIAIAQTSDRRKALPYVFAPVGVSHAAPIAIDVTQDGISIYGGAVAWNDVRGELGQLVESQRASTSMNLSAALTIARDVEVRRLVDVLGAAAAAGFVEVDLAIDMTPAPAVAGGGASSRGGGIPSVSIGQPSVAGDLDKAIIRRYIKRNIQKITYCYEKQLLATGDIQGTIVVLFTILPTGTVRDTKASGVHPSVSACVASVVDSIEFPKPKDGGSVRVSYPFTFRPGGG